MDIILGVEEWLCVGRPKSHRVTHDVNSDRLCTWRFVNKTQVKSDTDMILTISYLICVFSIISVFITDVIWLTIVVQHFGQLWLLRST